MRTSRRSFLKASGMLAAAAKATPIAPYVGAGTEATGPVNIIYLHSHDSGRYLSPYGHAVPTPNLMRIAKSGIVFRQMFSAAPTCSPSRAALLTGQTPHASGMNGLAHRGWSLHDYGQHMIHTLGKHGYKSVLVGVQHVARPTESAVIGFDEVLPGSWHAVEVGPRAVKWLRNKPKEPFFMDCGFTETHREYPEATDDPNHVVPPAPVPDTPATRMDMARYHQCARNLDDAIGKILDALEETGLAANTLIISTTDHGIAFPHAKSNLRDSGIGVSFLMHGPGVFSKPGVCDAMLSHVDVFPTLCEYLGIEKPSWLTGTSFLPVVKGKQEEIHEAVFAELTYHAAYEPQRAVRTHRYKYIKRFDGRTSDVIANCDEGLSKAYWMSKGWKGMPLVQEEELFDLVFDPHEHTNLVSDAGHATVLAEMRGRLKTQMETTNDPLLKGPVPLVQGGLTTPVDNDLPDAPKVKA